MTAKSWFSREPGDSRSLRLYCFAHAGGNSAAYLPWRSQLGKNVGVYPVQLPGRGRRFLEPSIETMPELVASVTDALAEEAPGPFAFFGHSMGALLAFEVSRRLQALALPLPELLIVSGCNSPQHLPPPKWLSRMPDEQMIDELHHYHGTPPEVLANTDLMSLLLPAIRADFSVFENYRYQPGALLTVPITAFAGREDTSRISDVDQWRNETTAAFRLHWFDGDHFFVQFEATKVIERIRDEVNDLPLSACPVAVAP